MDKDEVLKLALDDLIAEYHMETSSFARRVDDIFKEALVAPVQEPVAWLDLSKMSDKGMVYATGFKVSDKQSALCLCTPPAQEFVCSTGLPDPIHHTDLSEHPEYISGWNDCRQAMLEMMK